MAVKSVVDPNAIAYKVPPTAPATPIVQPKPVWSADYLKGPMIRGMESAAGKPPPPVDKTFAKLSAVEPPVINPNMPTPTGRMGPTKPIGMGITSPEAAEYLSRSKPATGAIPVEAPAPASTVGTTTAATGLKGIGGKILNGLGGAMATSTGLASTIINDPKLSKIDPTIAGLKDKAGIAQSAVPYAGLSGALAPTTPVQTPAPTNVNTVSTSPTTSVNLPTQGTSPKPYDRPGQGTAPAQPTAPKTEGFADDQIINKPDRIYKPIMGGPDVPLKASTEQRIDLGGGNYIGDANARSEESKNKMRGILAHKYAPTQPASPVQKTTSNNQNPAPAYQIPQAADYSGQIDDLMTVINSPSHGSGFDAKIAHKKQVEGAKASLAALLNLQKEANQKATDSAKILADQEQNRQRGLLDRDTLASHVGQYDKQNAIAERGLDITDRNTQATMEQNALERQRKIDHDAETLGVSKDTLELAKQKEANTPREHTLGDGTKVKVTDAEWPDTQKQFELDAYDKDPANKPTTWGGTFGGKTDADIASGRAAIESKYAKPEAAKQDAQSPENIAAQINADTTLSPTQRQQAIAAFEAHFGHPISTYAK